MQRNGKCPLDTNGPFYNTLEEAENNIDDRFLELILEKKPSVLAPVLEVDEEDSSNVISHPDSN